MITANSKYQAVCMDAKSFIIKYSDTSLRFTKSCDRAVLDERFKVQNHSSSTIVGFLGVTLSRRDELWRKVTEKFSCRELAAYIS